MSSNIGIDDDNGEGLLPMIYISGPDSYPRRGLSYMNDAGLPPMPQFLSGPHTSYESREQPFDGGVPRVQYPVGQEESNFSRSLPPPSSTLTVFPEPMYARTPFQDPVTNHLLGSQSFSANPPSSPVPATPSTALLPQNSSRVLRTPDASHGQLPVSGQFSWRVNIQPQDIYIHNDSSTPSTLSSFSEVYYPSSHLQPRLPYSRRANSEGPDAVRQRRNTHNGEYAPGGYSFPPSLNTAGFSPASPSPAQPRHHRQYLSPPPASFPRLHRCRSFPGAIDTSLSRPLSISCGESDTEVSGCNSPSASYVSDDESFIDWPSLSDLSIGDNQPESPVHPTSLSSSLDLWELSVVRGSVGTTAMKAANRKRKHKSGPSFPCPICFDTLATKFSLERHKNTHFGKRYPCTRPPCSVTFGNPSDRQRHIKKQHEARETPMYPTS